MAVSKRRSATSDVKARAVLIVVVDLSLNRCMAASGGRHGENLMAPKKLAPHGFTIEPAR